MISPQAIRSPAFPVGSVFMSSRFGVDHQRRAAIAEDGMIVAAHRHHGGHHRSFRRTIGAHGEVRQISGMRPGRIQRAVLLPIRIEMSAGGFEIRCSRTQRSGGRELHARPEARFFRSSCTCDTAVRVRRKRSGPNAVSLRVCIHDERAARSTLPVLERPCRRPTDKGTGNKETFSWLRPSLGRLP